MRLEMLCSVCFSCSCSCCRSASRQRWRSLRPCSSRVCSFSGGGTGMPHAGTVRVLTRGRRMGLLSHSVTLGWSPPCPLCPRTLARVSSQGLHSYFQGTVGQLNALLCYLLRDRAGWCVAAYLLDRLKDLILVAKALLQQLSVFPLPKVQAPLELQLLQHLLLLREQDACPLCLKQSQDYVPRLPESCDPQGEGKWQGSTSPYLSLLVVRESILGGEEAEVRPGSGCGPHGSGPPNLLCWDEQMGR